MFGATVPTGCHFTGLSGESTGEQPSAKYGATPETKGSVQQDIRKERSKVFENGAQQRDTTASSSANPKG